MLIDSRETRSKLRAPMFCNTLKSTSNQREGGEEQELEEEEDNHQFRWQANSNLTSLSPHVHNLIKKRTSLVVMKPTKQSNSSSNVQLKHHGSSWRLTNRKSGQSRGKCKHYNLQFSSSSFLLLIIITATTTTLLSSNASAPINQVIRPAEAARPMAAQPKSKIPQVEHTTEEAELETDLQQLDTTTTLSSATAGQRQAHFAKTLETMNETAQAGNVQRVAVGRSASFKCVVNDIGEHKIAWFHKDKRQLLAFDNRTLVSKDRIQASSQGNSLFFLQIDNVQLSDKGQYSCQLNTQPVQSQIHILDIVKSPQIVEKETTVNIGPVKEFSSIELRCVADGIPKPVIKWRRESQFHELPAYSDDEMMIDQVPSANDKVATNEHDDDEHHDDANDNKKNSSNNTTDTNDNHDHDDDDESNDNSVGRKEKLASASDNGTRPVAGNDTSPHPQMASKSAAEGEVLRIERVSRYDMGYYICIASNGVPPSVAQRIFCPSLIT